MNKRRRFKAKRRRDRSRMLAERQSRRFWQRFKRDVAFTEIHDHKDRRVLDALTKE